LDDGCIKNSLNCNDKMIIVHVESKLICNTEKSHIQSTVVNISVRTIRHKNKTIGRDKTER